MTPAGCKVTKGEPLFPRIDPKSIEIKEEPKEETPSVQFKDEITFDDFSKLDLRVAVVKDCQPVKKADKLLQFTLDVGGEERTIVSGIRKFYDDPAALIGKSSSSSPIWRQEDPRTSAWMILTAATDDDSALEVLSVENAEIPSGATIS
mgnify:CR=1 FL=1